MASAMLATYPDVFSAGAIISGLPYGCATTVEEAFAAMFGNRKRTGRPLGDYVREASPHAGPWPRISVWHGTADPIVRAVNAEEIVQQWLEVNGMPQAAGREELGPGYTRRVWENGESVPIIESYLITGMGHGVPIAVGTSPESCGAVAPFFIPVGISSTRRIAKFWGLAKAEATVRSPAAVTEPAIEVPRVPAIASSMMSDHADSDRASRTNASRGKSRSLDPNAVIAAAFEAAGLPVPDVDKTHQGVAPGPIIAAAMKAAGVIKS
jgi:feruloyl esterase